MKLFYNSYRQRKDNGEPFHKTSFIDTVDGKKKNTNCFTAWNAMRYRVFNEKNKVALKSWENCSINAQWFDFQNFADFFYNDKFRKDGWHLDKDLLVRGNKEYGPDTCCFLPQELNQLIKAGGFSKKGNPTGVYRNQEGNAVWYEAHCRTDRKVSSGYLGSFKSEEEASNAYIQHKEAWVRSRADQYVGIIDERAVEALRNWTFKFEDTSA